MLSVSKPCKDVPGGNRYLRALSREPGTTVRHFFYSIPQYYFRTALRQSLFVPPPLFHNVMNDCAKVDELLLDLADYKNDYADMAAEQLLRKCSTSWDAYRYLLDRVHDVWLPDSARQQVRQIIKKIQVQLNQQREYGWEYEVS